MVTKEDFEAVEALNKLITKSIGNNPHPGYILVPIEKPRKRKKINEI